MGTRTRGHQAVRGEKCKGIALAHGKEHAVALDTFDSTRGKVGDVGELPADQLGRVAHIRSNTRDDGARPALLTKIYRAFDEFVCLWDALGRTHRADAYLDLA